MAKKKKHGKMPKMGASVDTLNRAIARANDVNKHNDGIVKEATQRKTLRKKLSDLRKK